MLAEDKLSALVDVARSLGMEVRLVDTAGAGRDGGALVRLKGREIVFLDVSAPLADRIDAVAGVLAGRKELEQLFLPPEIREAIEQAAEGDSKR